MPLFSAVGTAIAAASAWFATLGPIAQFGVRLLASVAFNALASALAGKPGERDRPGITGEIQQGADIPRAFIMGRYATAGSLAYHNHWGGSDNEHYTRITALSDLPVAGLAELWIDGEKVTLDTDNPDPDGKGYPVIEFSETETRRRMVGLPDRGQDNVYEEEVVTRAFAWVKFHDGTQTEADSFVVDNVSTEERPWTAQDVGYGVAYAVTTFRINRKLFQGFPELIFVLDGIEMYDPASETTGPSVSPAVQAYTLLQGLSYGGDWVYGPQSPGRLVDAEWAAEVATCAEDVPGTAGMTDQQKIEAFGSSEVPARYRSGLEVKVDQPVADVLEDILAACNGRISEVGTRYRFQVGDPGAAVASLTDGDILSTSGQSFAPFFPLAETVNAVTATYPEPEESWQSQDAPPLYNPDYEADDGDRRLPTTVQLDAVPYREQVQRLMAAALAEARRARRHTVRLPARYWALEPGDVVSWTSERNGYEAKLMRVDGLVDLPGGDISVDLTEVDPTDYAWAVETDFTPVASGSISAQPLLNITVSGWSVSATTILDGADTSRRPAIVIRWSDPERDDITGVQCQVRLQGTGIAVPARGTDDIEAQAHILSEGILPGTVYEVRARFRAPGRRTEWTGWTQVTTPDVRLSLADLQADVTGWLEGLRDWITGGVTDLPGDLTGLSQAIASEAQTRAAAIQDAADALTAEQAARVEDAQLLATRLRSTSDRVRALTAQAQELAAASHTAREEIRRTLVVEIEEMRASFSEEIVTLADAQLAAALRLTTLEAESADLSADITQVDQARVEGDQALSQLITALNVGTAVSFDQLHIWYFDSTAEGWTGTPANPTPQPGGYIRPAEGAGATVVSPAGLAVDPDQYRQVRLRLQRTGTPTWVGWLWWAGEGQGWDTARRVAIPEPSWAGDEARLTINPDWAGEVDRIRLDLADQGASDYVEIDWIAVGRPAPGASSADLASLRQTVIDGDAALAEDITQLEAEMTSAQDSINGVAGAVDAVETRVQETEEGLSATGNRLDGVEAELQGSNGLDALSEAIDTLAAETETQGDAVRTRSEALRSLSSAMRMLSSEAAETAARDKLAGQAVREVIAEADQRLGTRIDATDGALEVVAEAVTTLEAAIPGLATSEALSSLSTTVTQQGDQLTSQSDAITSLQGEVAGKASSAALTSLSNTVSQQGSDITTNADAITSLQGEVAGKASSSALTSLSNTVSQQGDDITTNADAITSLQGEVAGKASSSALTSLSNTVSQQGSDITANADAITSLQGEVAGKASSSALTSLSNTVSQQGSDITTNADAITSLQGEVAGKASSSALSSLSNTVSQQGSDITSNANALTSLNAEVGKFSAQGLLRARVEATPAGASSRIGLYAAASAGEGTARPAALFLESVSGGGSRIVAQADRFAVTDGSGSVVPFVVAGGTVYIADARVRTLSIEAGGLTDMDTSGSGVVTNNSAFETTICQCSVDSGPGASKVIGQVTFNLTASISSFPSDFEVRVYVGGQLRSQLTQGGMSAVPEQRRFDVQFPTDGITGNPAIRAAIVNAGGGGVDFSSIWALALKR